MRQQPNQHLQKEQKIKQMVKRAKERYSGLPNDTQRTTENPSEIASDRFDGGHHFGLAAGALLLAAVWTEQWLHITSTMAGT